MLGKFLGQAYLDLIRVTGIDTVYLLIPTPTGVFEKHPILNIEVFNELIKRFPNKIGWDRVVEVDSVAANKYPTGYMIDMTTIPYPVSPPNPPLPPNKYPVTSDIEITSFKEGF